jgi:hypothetical protein
MLEEFQQKQNEDENQEDEIIDTPDELKVTAYFEQITYFGIADIRFSAPMNTEQLNLTEINSTVVDIYI